MNVTIAWLYPELMNTYGDLGNIMVLNKRCLWRNINCQVRYLNQEEWQRWEEVDLVFMGGAQDRQQELVAKDLFAKKSKKAFKIKSKIKKGIPGLFICGAFQFMGKFYQTADDKKIPGIKIFDIYTKNRQVKEKRLVGNIVIQCKLGGLETSLVGFENHGGRTYLGGLAKPFAAVLKGFGNNGLDKTEGCIYKNAIGTYLHGPILPKNPKLADWLIGKALQIKYGKVVKLARLDDTIENEAKSAILRKMS